MIPVAKLSRNFHQFYFKFQFFRAILIAVLISVAKGELNPNEISPPRDRNIESTFTSNQASTSTNQIFFSRLLFPFTKFALHTKRIYTRTHLENIHGAKLENKRCRSWEPFFNPPTPVPPPPPPPFRSPVLLATTLSSLESVRIYARLQTIVRVMRQKLEKEKKKSVPFTFEGRYEFGKEEFLGLDERIWRDGIINRKDRNFYTGFYSLFFAREKSLGYLRYLFERVFSLFRALRISHLSFSFWTVYFGNGG